MTPAASTLAIAMLGGFVVCLQIGSCVWQIWETSWEKTDWESQREQQHISSLQLGQGHAVWGCHLRYIREMHVLRPGKGRLGKPKQQSVNHAIVQCETHVCVPGWTDQG